MKKSLQKFEDFYIQKGFAGTRLRNVLSQDKEYQKLLQERKSHLTKQFSVTTSEKRKYVLSINQDYEILSKIKTLESAKLNKNDKFLIHIIRTQLEQDWRKQLIMELNKLLRKYRIQ